MDGLVGWWVSSCTDFTFTFTFTLPILSFLSMMGGLFYLFFLVPLILWSFLLGTIFKEKSSYNPAKKNSRKGVKIS